MEILHRYHIRMRMRDLKQGRQSVLCVFSDSCCEHRSLWEEPLNGAPSPHLRPLNLQAFSCFAPMCPRDSLRAPFRPYPPFCRHLLLSVSNRGVKVVVKLLP